MRFLILIALCISAALAFDFKTFSGRYFSAVQAEKPEVRLHIGSSSELRSKRASHKKPLEDPDKCIFNCTKDVQKRIQESNITDSDNFKHAAEVCKANEPTESCYKACPDSLLRNLTLDYLPTLTQLCSLGNKNNFSAWDCFNANNIAVQDKCGASCNLTLVDGFEASVDVYVLVNSPYIEYDDNKERNAFVLNGICKYRKCKSECGDSLIKEKCGQIALDVGRNVASAVFRFIINSLKSVGALDGDVEECQAIL